MSRLYPEFKYYDTAFGGFRNRNIVMESKGIKERLSKTYIDCSTTWHRFDQSFADKVKKTGTVAGYDGPSYADFLIFDFDRKDDISGAQEITKQFVKDLQVTFEVTDLKGVYIWFSGSKGFHVALSAGLFGGWMPSPWLYRQLKELAIRLAGNIELDTQVYDKTRLLRLPGTVHPSSGKYKTQITSEELLFLPTTDIIGLASNHRDAPKVDWNDCSPSQILVDVYAQVVEDGKKKKEKTSVPDDGPLFKSNMQEGDGRDAAAFRLARWHRDQGVRPLVTLEILKFWDSQQKDPLGEKIIREKIQSAYKITAGGVEANQSDEKVTEDDLLTKEELVEKYRQYILQLGTRKIYTGFGDIDMITRGVAPGEVFTLIARSGAGKSAFAGAVILNVEKNQPDVLSMFISLEQPESLCAERFMLSTAQITGEEVEKTFLKGDPTYLVKNFLGRGNGFVTCCAGGLTIDDIEKAFYITQKKTGRRPGAIFIDYLGYIQSNARDNSTYEKVSKIARGIKDLAKKLDVAVFLLCQVGRGGGDGDVPLDLSSARDSGAIEESADFLVGLYRPNTGTDEDKIAAFQILKNRKGRNGVDMHYGWKGETLTFYPITKEEAGVLLSEGDSLKRNNSDRFVEPVKKKKSYTNISNISGDLSGARKNNPEECNSLEIPFNDMDIPSPKGTRPLFVEEAVGVEEDFSDLDVSPEGDGGSAIDGREIDDLDDILGDLT